MPILVIGGFLILFGIFAIYSVSIYESFKLTLKLNEIYQDPSNYFFFIRQLKNLLIAIIAGIAIYFVPLDFIKKYKGKIFLGTLLFLLLVFTPMGVSLKGARGWIEVRGFGTVQPGEFVKLGFVMFFAGWLLKKQKTLPSFEGFVSMVIVTGLGLFLFLLIPDFGTLLVLGPIALIMYVYAGGNIRYVLASVILGIIFTFTVGTNFKHVKDRIEYFLHPEVDKTNRGVGYQTRQGLIAIGGGGLIGKGYGKGLQKFGFIPEAESDFIFAAFSEEIGFLGNTVLLLLYFLLARFAIKRIELLKDPYYKMFSFGIISLIFWQAFINIGVNIKLIPLTGLTLPFISYGGTALLVNLLELSLLYKILYKR